VRQTAARQLAFRAATSSGSIAPPRVLSSDPWHLHGEMRKRIAALEKTIANLPTDLGPLDQNEIEELKKEIARLKAVPAAPTDLPADAVKAKTKWQERGEKVLVGLSTTAISETSKALWARFGDQLIDGAKAIGEWIASLNLP
jgi:hypothetical protein